MPICLDKPAATRPGHRSTRSVSSLPSDLQRLSLNTDDNKMVTQLPFTNTNTQKAPSWLQPAPVTTTTTAATTTNTTTATANTTGSLVSHTNSASLPFSSTYEPKLPSLSSAFSQYRRAPRPAGASHGRSISDLPPLQHQTNQHNQHQHQHQHHQYQHQTQSPLSRLNANYHHPHRPSHAARAAGGHYQHRRAVSANTVEFMMQPTPTASSSSSSSSSSSASPPLAPQQPSATMPSNLASSSPPPPASRPNDQDELGRYLCPFCQKGFSRPSSLRIHTYSHTGEKPFVCTEEGCGRRFSVQSNMRRHLRVHRMGRSYTKPNSPLSRV
ncbi:hypothetical protein BCR43DRAFT_461205 [Syncephalastrum racemosum]|uniref:C2H2-type domain-containing protein n=1 Tax=Syncephalastrum racemosum TaxID=13706 RepID=A0A1X2H763_SYNRA|nr:hypothetical protein BCR43DRAFT_461205 [Syncephalastrum racemosum]